MPGTICVHGRFVNTRCHRCQREVPLFLVGQGCVAEVSPALLGGHRGQYATGRGTDQGRRGFW